MRKRLFSALFILAFSITILYGQQETPKEIVELLKSVPSRDSFPSADFYVVAETTYLRFLPDNTYEKEIYKLIKSYTYGGKKKLSNYKITYSADWEEVEILLARTINRDSCYYVGEKEINVISHPDYRSAAIFGKIEQKVVTFSNFVDTSAIEIRYRIRCKSQPKVPFDGIQFLADENPCGISVLSIAFPEGKPINYVEINGLSKGRELGGRVVWELRKWGGFKPEPNMPPLRELCPAVIYTQFRNWNEAAEFVALRILAKAIPNDVVTSLTESLSAGKEGIKIVESILFYVQEKIDHIEAPSTLFGYLAREPENTVSQGYGDNKDLCVLLMAMLKTRNIESSLAMISGAKVFDIPSLSQFSEFAVLVNIDGENIFLKPDEEYYSIDYIGSKRGENALVIRPGEGKIISIPLKPSENKVIFDFKLTLTQTGGLSGTLTTSGDGKFAASIREMFRNVRKRRLKQIIEDAVSDVATGARALRDTIINVENNFTTPKVMIEFSAEKYATLQGNMMIFWFPRLPFDIIDFPDVLASDRKLRLFIDEPFVFEENISLEIPDGWKIDYIPQTSTIEDPGGSFRIESSSNNNTIKITLRMNIDQKRIEVRDYEKFRKMVKSLFAKRNKIILLEKEL